MKFRILIVMTVLSLAPGTLCAQQGFADRFFAGIEKDALRDLERGKPAKQLEAARTLGADHLARTAPVLAQLLSDRDPAIRLGAAELIWNLAPHQPQPLALTQPALRIALEDPDALIAMNAAGALTALKVPAAETAPARRRVLQAGQGSVYVRFLAARGLIGIDAGAPLAPPLLDYLFQASAADSAGGSRENRDLAVQALKALVGSQDRALIPVLEAELGTAHPATEHLLELIHKFEPRPDGWTQTLLEHARSPNRDVEKAAWYLLADQKDAHSVTLWAPLAVQRLAHPASRGSALSALSAVAGRSVLGLDELADLAMAGTTTDEHREQALGILGKAAEVTGQDVDQHVAAAALKAWQRACDPLLGSGPANKRFEACYGHLYYIFPDDRRRSELLAGWLRRNGAVEAKLRLLAGIESQWGKGVGATETVKQELTHADPRVVQAAEAALDRIRPAWRESAARQARLSQTIAAPAQPVPESTSGRRGADGAALFEAISVGNLAKVKQLVNAGNVHTPVHYPQLQGSTPVPIGIAINYCGIPTLTPVKLAAVVDYLIGLGAQPDSADPTGDNLLDRAKQACPPEVMQALMR